MTTPSIGRTLLHYRLVKPLGEGGMGVVWGAHDDRLDREVALKILPDRVAADPDSRVRFIREAKAVAALNHPNIVTIYAVEEHQGSLFLTMELLRGRTLDQCLAPGGLSLPQLLGWSIPLVDAVDAAHKRGIIHCDLKPSNVFVTDSGTVKVLDFGLARHCGTNRRQLDSHAPTLTEPLRFSGTIPYMSPEQLRSEPLDHRTDLYSLGVILFEMACGRRPFTGDSPAEVIAAIFRDSPPSVDRINPRIPPRMAFTIQSCIERDPSLRLQSAADLRHQLELCREQGSAQDNQRVPSIAVLPFKDLSREHDQVYFCEGMAEEIINSLSRIRGLRVASRTASFRFRDSADSDPREIGRRLNVGTVLEGSIRKSGIHLRITAQLIDTADGYHLWSECYDRDMTDIFRIQEEIGRNIAAALQVTLSPQEETALERAPTRHSQAYDYYLRGRKFFAGYSRRDVEFALQLFSRAVELDPSFAMAYAGLADCWSYLFFHAEHTEAIRAEADRQSQRAVEIDPDCAPAQVARGIALSLSARDEEAVRAFEKAIQLDKLLFEAWYFYARHVFSRGDKNKAIALYEQACAVRPEDYQSPLLMAQSYEDLGRPEEARAARVRGVEAASRQIKADPEDARALYMAANGLAALGEVEKSLEWTHRALLLQPDEPMVLYNAACIFAMLNHPEQALDCLSKSVSRGFSMKPWLLYDSNLDSVRPAPRFQAIVARLES